MLNKIRSKHLVESNYITSHFCSLEILNFLMEQKKKMIFCTCILNAVQGKGIDHVKSGLGTACPRGWRQWPISATEILERATRGICINVSHKLTDSFDNELFDIIYTQQSMQSHTFFVRN